MVTELPPIGGHSAVNSNQANAKIYANQAADNSATKMIVCNIQDVSDILAVEDDGCEERGQSDRQ